MKTRILIVEDEGIIALNLQTQLEDLGYAVPSVADNAADALIYAERDKPALVLMDIRIRGERNGIETAALIRKKFHLPVIFVTAHADRETLEQAKITGPFGYIVKPFHHVDFRAQIEMALEKHRMETQLRRSEAWLSAVVRSVADALIATDAEGNVSFMNDPASQLTGWEASRAKGKPLLEVFQVFDATTGYPVIHPLEALYDGRELSTGTAAFRMKAPGAHPLLIEAEISANRGLEGELLGIVVVFRDVTARREAEARERQMLKHNAVTLLATGLAGELFRWQKRMEGILDRLAAGSGSRRLHRILDEARVCARHQASVVGQLSALADSEPAQPREVDLNRALLSLEEPFEDILGVSRKLRWELQPGIPPIAVDPEELRENVLRLVVSCRAAMPDGGAIVIQTRAVTGPGGQPLVRLSLKDSGSALPSGAADSVFDPYAQSRRGTPDSGMSLALVWRFAARYGAFLEARNGGGGVMFLLGFPASQPVIHAEPACASGHCTVPQSVNRHV